MITAIDNDFDTTIYCYRTSCKHCKPILGKYREDGNGSFGACELDTVTIGRNGKCLYYEDELEKYEEIEDMRIEMRNEDDGNY